ncbi:MAG: SMC-Scp complex subunit ScpB [Lentisphaerae bacterium]|nr:SMC-Scp complex subunit ScpB [Lentisphaerota bacterium]
MSDVEVLPELKEIVGAVLFAARQPVSAEQILQVFAQTAERTGGFTRDYAAVTAADIAAAVAALGRDLETARSGLRLAEVAQGYRLESPAACGPWLRTFLERGRPQRLTPPALETLAIIAYRQPVMRSEIEAVRGVAVDQILRNLLDMQLIRIAGRSDLPGRPWLFGTSQKFLEHFGLKNLDDLPGTDELRRREEQKARDDAQRQLDLGTGNGAGGEATGFKADIDTDRPGEDDVTAELAVAEQEDAGDLPDARPAGAAPPSPDETDAIRPDDYEDDLRVSPPPRRRRPARPPAPAAEDADDGATPPADGGPAAPAKPAAGDDDVPEGWRDDGDDDEEFDDDESDDEDEGDDDADETGGDGTDDGETVKT